MENEAYKEARKKVEAKLGFYIHLAIYIVIGALLAIINFSTSNDTMWFKWPLIGWGIGVLWHGLGVFVLTGKSAIKEKMIEKEMKKEAQMKQ